VYNGLYNGQKVAIKELNGKCDLEMIKRESAIPWLIERNEHVVHSFGWSVNNGTISIILEFCDGGSLRDWVQNNNGKITPEKKLDFAKQLAVGLTHLHKYCIIHRDFRAPNILIQTRRDFEVLKIADFGLSRVILGSTPEFSISNPYWYSQAPEIIGTIYDKTPGEEGLLIPYSKKTDVWSYGIVLAEIGNEKHERLSPKTFFDKINNLEGKTLEPEITNKCGILSKYIMACCKLNPANRPAMATVSLQLQEDWKNVICK